MIPAINRQPGWSDLLSGRNLLGSIALSCGVALHATDIFIATTMLPSVVRDIGGLEYYAWNTTLFVVASIIGSSLVAKLIHSVTARGAYFCAIAIFSIGSMICALAPSMMWMLLGRTVQGFGGGMLFALSYAMVRLAFPAALWTYGITLVSGMWGVATLCGPALGGIFAQMSHWRYAYWVMVPVALLLGMLIYFFLRVPRENNVTTMQLPVLKLTLLAISVLAISVGSLSHRLDLNLISVLLGVTIAFFIVLLDRKDNVKLLPTGAYSFTSQLGVVYAVMTLLIIAITVEIFVPYFLQVIHHFKPLMAGYLSALLSAGWTLGSIVSTKFTGRAANRIIKIGIILMVIALLMLTIAMPLSATYSLLVIPSVIAALVLLGLGIGLGWSHLLSMVLRNVIKSEEHLAGASITTVQLFAMAFGAALAGMIGNLAGFNDPGGVTGAMHAARWVFASFTITPILALVIVCRKMKEERGS